MKTLTLTEGNPEDIRAGAEVQIRDAAGNSLGYFTVTQSPAEKWDMGISEEEFRRRLDAPNGVWYTAAEVEAKMKEWGCST